MDREFRAGVPVVLVLSHLGIWELFAQLMPKFVGYVRNASVYQKLGNRFIDAHVRRTRGQTGLELFDRQQGFQPVIDLLRSGGGVGVLSDQHAGDHGLWTPFFGRLASTSPLPALLAKRTRAALIAAGVYTIGPARWRLVFTERFDPPKAEGSVVAADCRNKSDHRTANSRRAGRLVLGAQSLEDAPAQLPSRAVQTWRLCTTGSFTPRSKAISNSHSFKQLAR